MSTSSPESEREAETIRRDALRGLIEPKDFTITSEERLTMRSIPYFVLPRYETVPQTDHITAKVNTRNTSYIPASKRSSHTAPSHSSKLPDYSHVRSKVDTGRRSSGGGEFTSTAARSLTRYPHSTSSLIRSRPVFGQTRSISASQLPARPASAAKYKSVKPRVNSLDNLHHKTGGGSKSPSKPSHHTRHTGKVRSAWDSPPADQQTKTDRVEKRVVRSRIDQTDRVEKRVVRSRIDQTDRVEKRVVRSRIDQTDPNPAHKLKHSLEELTLSYGRTVNPRFAEKKDRNKLYRRHSTSVVDPVTSKETPGGKRTLKKSVTLGALPATEPSVLQELTKSQLTEITEETPHSDPTEETPHSDPTEEPPHSDPTEETPHSDPTEEPPHSNRIEETPYSEATEESEAMDGKSSPRESLEETSLYQTIDTSQPQHDGLNERKDKPAIANGNAHSLSEESPPPSPPPVEDDLVVTDIEVTHTETSTTVILSHLWGRSSLAGENQLSTIDEGEDNYYEVEDDPEDRVLAAVSAATLPHGIPKLCVTDETGELVEVLVDPQAESERAGQLSEEHADELQDNLSELVINCNGDSSFDDTSTSTRL